MLYLNFDFLGVNLTSPPLDSKVTVLVECCVYVLMLDSLELGSARDSKVRIDVSENCAKCGRTKARKASVLVGLL